jgi:hypothetical protein
MRNLRSSVVPVVSAALAALAAAAIVRAQEPTPTPGPIGTIEFYRIQDQAPQFVEARKAIKDPGDEAAVLQRVCAIYSMLSPDQFDRAIALERTEESERTMDQRKELDALRATDGERAARFRALLQTDKPTPETDAEFDGLRGTFDACAEHKKTASDDVQRRLDDANARTQQKVSAALDAAVTKVAREKDLAAVLQSSVRTVGRDLDTGVPVIEYHRIVHYGGADVTDDVLAELVKENNAERGVPEQ